MTNQPMPSETAALHHRCLGIDSHNDSIVHHIRRGSIGLAGENSAERRSRLGAVRHLREHINAKNSPLQLNIPLMREGGIDAAFFAVDVTLAWHNHLLYALDALGFAKREIAEHSDDIVLALNAADIATAKSEGRLAALLAVENSDALQRSLYVLDALYEIGVRTMTLTHSTRSHVADGCEVEGGGGLTGFGREVVAAMNSLGMIVDVSHLNERSFWDTLKCSKQPLLASHSCCRELCDHPRNLDDEQLAALAAEGGVVAITYVPMFISEVNPDLAGLLDHIEHAVAVAGIDHVGLGSDFDGGGTLLTDAAEVPGITAGLAARGYGEEELEMILGRNHMRLLAAVVG